MQGRIWAGVLGLSVVLTIPARAEIIKGAIGYGSGMP